MLILISSFSSVEAFNSSSGPSGQAISNLEISSVAKPSGCKVQIFFLHTKIWSTLFSSSGVTFLSSSITSLNEFDLSSLVGLAIFYATKLKLFNWFSVISRIA